VDWYPDLRIHQQISLHHIRGLEVHPAFHEESFFGLLVHKLTGRMIKKRHIFYFIWRKTKTAAWYLVNHQHVFHSGLNTRLNQTEVGLTTRSPFYEAVYEAVMAIELQFLGHPDYTGGEVVHITRQSWPSRGNSMAKATYKKSSLD